MRFSENPKQVEKLFSARNIAWNFSFVISLRSCCMLLRRYSNTGFGGEIFSEIERFKLYRTNLIIILLDESKGILKLSSVRAEFI